MLTFSFALRITISSRKVSPQRERKKSALDRDGIAALFIRTGSPMASLSAASPQSFTPTSPALSA